MQNLMDDLSGSSFYRHHRFLSFLETYVRSRRAFFRGKIASGELITASELSALPLFAFDDGTSDEIVRDAAGGLTYLAAVSALAGALAIRRFSTTTSGLSGGG
jgi:hypothetical protein